jgi:signal peptidase I
MWRRIMAPVVAMGIPIFVFPRVFGLDAPHGRSMEPTIASSGEIIFCVRYFTSTPVVGDIVVARSPVEPQKTVMKRVRAVGGDYVRYDSTESEYFQYEMKKMFERLRDVNPAPAFQTNVGLPSSPSTEPEVGIDADESSNTEPLIETQEHFPSTDREFCVPTGQIWIEGDNPALSTDSRHYGPIPIALVEARAAYCIWPPSQFRKLGRNVVDRESAS